MISPLIDTALDAELAPLDIATSDLPERGLVSPGDTGREILEVEGYTLVTGSLYKRGLGLDTAATAARIIVTGQPGPGSTAERGILRLVPRKALREPIWDRASRTIDLTLHHTIMSTLLAQLDKPRRILWMGRFDGGAIYGDLHAAD